MDRKKLTIGVVVGALLILGVFVGLMSWKYFTGPPSAVLKSADGEVEVNGAQAEQKSKLFEGDKIKTGIGSATVVFFGNSLMRMDNNTEIVLKVLSREDSEVAIKQKTGRTWNKVVKKIQSNYGADAFGGVEKYGVDLPTAVATVRGTSFSCKLDSVSVAKGEVNLKTNSQTEEVENSTAVLKQKKIDLTNLVENNWVTQNQKKDKKFNEGYADRFIEEHPIIVTYLKVKHGWNKTEVRDYTLRYLRGDSEVVRNVKNFKEREGNLTEANLSG